MVEIFLLTGIYLYCTVESSAEIHLTWYNLLQLTHPTVDGQLMLRVSVWEPWIEMVSAWNFTIYLYAMDGIWCMILLSYTRYPAILNQISHRSEPDIPPFWTRYPTILDQISHHSEPDIPPFWIYFVNCIDLAFAYNITSLFKMHCICTTIHNCMVVHMYE